MLYYLGKGTEFKKENCKEYKTIEGVLRAAAKDENLVVWDETGKVIGSLTDNVPEGALQENPDGSVNTYDAAGNKTGTLSAEQVAAVVGGDNGQQGNGNDPQSNENGEGQTNPPEPEKGQDGANTKPHEAGDAAVVGGDNGQQGNGNDPQSNENGEGQTNTPPEPEKGQDGANTKPHEAGDAAGGSTGGDDGQQDSENDAAGEAVSDSDTGKEKPEVVIPQGTMKVTVICDGALNLRRSPEWGSRNICGRAVRGQTYYVKAIHTVAGKKMVQTVDDIFLSGQSEHVQFEQL